MKIQGNRVYTSWRRLRCHGGPGVDTSTSADVRSGAAAAKRSAARPPNEMPQIAARSRPRSRITAEI